jgi:hypothetical protein
MKSLICASFIVLLAACGTEPRIAEPLRESQVEDAALFGDPGFSEWSAPERLDISTPNFAENTPAISTDGLALYFGSQRTGTIGSNDIWVSRRASADDAWGTPENVGAPVNSVVLEVGPSLSIDGRYLFFSSNRPSSADEVGVCGGGAATAPNNFCDNDIYVSKRECDATGCRWGVPENLGPGVNTPLFEGGQAFWGLHLYFNRGGTANPLPGAPDAGPPGDIFASRLGLEITPGDGVSLEFQTAEPVTALNSDAVDQRPAFRLDGREIYFTSARSGTPDIWVSRRRTLFSPWSAPERVAVINTDNAQELHPSLSADGTTLYFSSNRAGSPDLYVSRRTRVR